MQVKVKSLLPPGNEENVTIETNPQATVQSLISSFCSQRGIAYNKRLTILDSAKNPLNHYSNLQSAGVTNGQQLYIEYIKTDTSRWHLYIAVFALIVGFTGILTMSLVYGLSGGKVPFDFGIVMDAGSSKTNSNLYKWPGDKYKGTGCVKQASACLKKGGIARQSNPSEYVEQLMECINTITAKIPPKLQPRTPLYFAATAGMRLLNLSDPTRASEILDQVKSGLNNTGLSVQQVSIILGRDEGIYAWTTSNYLKKTLDKENTDPWSPITYGALDLGGASTQIVFALPPDSSYSDSDVDILELYGQNHTVFSKSYLCFGRDEIARRYRAILVQDPSNEDIDDPCTPAGANITLTGDYLFNQPCTNSTKFKNWILKDPTIRKRNYTFHGKSDYDSCQKIVPQLTSYTTCQKAGFKECFEKPVRKPKDQKFLAFANFFYTTDFLNLTTSTLEQYENVTKYVCEKSSAEIFPNSAYKNEICFNANFIHEVLVNGYGFNETTWKNLEFLGNINGDEIGWAFGYMVNGTNLMPRKKPSSKAITPVVLTICLLVFIIAVIATVVYIFHTMCQRKGGFNPSRA